MDSHTGVFFEAKWRWLGFLNRFLSRRASLTIVTNAFLKQQVESWEARAFVLEDPLPVLLPSDTSYVVDPSYFNVIGIFSFYEDEPIEEMLAVRHLPEDVRIYMTGDSSRLKSGLKAGLSDHLVLTGFLSDEDYVALLRQCHAALVLCTRPHTLLCGAYEAVAAGKPLITSESAAMRAYFSKGTVFVDNTTASIETGIREARQRHDELAKHIAELRKELEQQWETRFTQCFAHLQR
jgi:glycosyltransferase involved in cell wall biosynthesis